MRGRPKKEYQAINIRADKKVAEDLERYCEETGLTKTVAIERILKKEFDKYFRREDDAGRQTADQS